jgi:hypothetical protein
MGIFFFDRVYGGLNYKGFRGGERSGVGVGAQGGSNPLHQSLLYKKEELVLFPPVKGFVLHIFI